MLSRVMLQPGDHAIIESPAVPNSVQALRYTGATVHTVPSGPDGVDIDALDEMCIRDRCLDAQLQPDGPRVAHHAAERHLSLIHI